MIGVAEEQGALEHFLFEFIKCKFALLIKRIMKKVIIAVTLLLLLTAGLYVAFRSSSVQSYLTQKMVSLLSDKLHTVIKIGGVDIQLFNSVILENVYIEDLHGDTLFYASTVKTGMKALEFKKRKIALTGLNVKNAVFRLKEYSTENFLNIQFIIDAFSDNDTTQKNWNILVDKVSLNNVRFYYINENARLPDGQEQQAGKGINYQDIEVSGIHSEIAGGPRATKVS